MIKTRDEITALKENWRADPCWDIEDTEGFEEHRRELREYRMDVEADAVLEKYRRLAAKAAQMGVPGNVGLAEYVEGLENRILRLEREAWGER